MPKLWDQTIQSHRHAIREAVLDAAEAEVAAHGLARATMTRIAERAGIGRATLYKYFTDVAEIVTAAHARHVEAHLLQLTDLVDSAAPVADRLGQVLAGYARICFFRARHGDGEMSALVHRSAAVAAAEERLVALFSRVLAEGQHAGVVRSDIGVDALAAYCLHALAAAGHDVHHASADQAVEQVVRLTLDGLR